jgi:zinc protease
MTINFQISAKLTNLALYLLGALLSKTSLAAAPPGLCELDNIATPLYNMERRIQYRVLDNGLQSRILALPEQQTVSIASQFAVGSVNEVNQQSGYAHLFEHMLFKGSVHAPGHSYVQTMNTWSGRFNAETSFDYTRYYLTLPKQALQLGLWLEADRFRYPLLSTTTVKNQQGAVLEEMAGAIDNQPYVRNAMEFLLAQVADTPYGHSVIGSVADIKAATPELLTAFHQEYYRPDAMQLSIVGAAPEQTGRWIEDNFGDWQVPSFKQDPMPALSINPRQVHGKISDVRGPWPALLLGWHTVGQSHVDAAAVRLVESYLFTSRASLVKQSGLVDPGHLLSYSMPVVMQQHGVSNIVLVPRARTSLDTLTQKVMDLIEPLKNSTMSAQQLCMLKQNWLHSALAQLNSSRSLAISLSATLAQDKLTPLSGPWQRIKNVTEADIRRIAKHYFNQNYVRIDLLPPWYIRATKTILEWLPKSIADSIEAGVL